MSAGKVILRPSGFIRRRTNSNAAVTIAAFAGPIPSNRVKSSVELSRYAAVFFLSIYVRMSLPQSNGAYVAHLVLRE